MKKQIFRAILEQHFDQADAGDTVHLPADVRVTVLVKSGEGATPIHRVRRVGFYDGYLELVTDDERYFVAPSRVVAVKQSEYGEEKVANKPGFHRA